MQIQNWNEMMSKDNQRSKLLKLVANFRIPSSGQVNRYGPLISWNHQYGFLIAPVALIPTLRGHLTRSEDRFVHPNQQLVGQGPGCCWTSRDVRDCLPTTKTCLALNISSVHTEKPSLNLRKENVGVNTFRKEDLSKSIGSFTIFTSISISSWFYRWLLAISPNNAISPQLGQRIDKVVTHPSFLLCNMWLPPISS